MARVVRGFAAFLTLASAGVLLSACGSSGAIGEVRQSCHFVHQAIVLQKKSEVVGTSKARVTLLQSEAIGELLKAEPYAARATSADGSWNPLMTTIGEAQRVSIDELIPSLEQICRVANSNSPYLGA
jgi:hypothetical protein